MRLVTGVPIAAMAMLLFASGATVAQPAPDVDGLEMAAPKQILFVGNSYLYYGDSLHNHVVRMARAADPDNAKAYRYKSATISGAYLAHHDLASHLEPNKLGLAEPFDVVVLQGHSTAATTPDKVESFRASVQAFEKEIAATGAKTALYMTPAYTEVHKSYDSEMMSKVEQVYTEVGNEFGALVIPVGLAFEEAYARRPEIELHKAFDGSHPTLLGTYLAASTVYAALYDSPVGNPYDYYGAISADDAAFLQRVAAATVESYYAR